MDKNHLKYTFTMWDTIYVSKFTLPPLSVIRKIRLANPSEKRKSVNLSSIYIPKRQAAKKAAARYHHQQNLLAYICAICIPKKHTMEKFKSPNTNIVPLQGLGVFQGLGVLKWFVTKKALHKLICRAFQKMAAIYSPTLQQYHRRYWA